MNRIDWDDKLGGEPTKVYSAKFTNPKKDFIIAGGADKNVAKIFHTETLKLV